MAADRAQLRFFVDESALGLGKSLAIARRDVVHTGHPLLPNVPLGTKDTEWIPIVGGMELVVFSRDKRIRTKPAEIQRLREHGLRVFWLASRQDLTTWEYLTRFVRHWDAIEQRVLHGQPGPWFVGVYEAGLRELSI